MNVSAALILAFLAGITSGCASPYKFPPPSSSAPVRFAVADQRPAEERILRRPEFRIPMDPTEKFGDDQFASDRISALASYFAEAFSNASPEPGLIVKTFELQMYTPKALSSRSGGVAVLSPALAGVLAAQSEKLDDWMLCFLDGSFDGVPFHVSVKETFEYRGREPEKVGAIVLQAAFGEAVRQVKAKRSLEGK